MEDQIEQRPKIGVGIMVIKDDKILFSKRKSSHGEGEFAFPGGHLEYMESFKDCANREITEECGIKIKNIKFKFLANVKKYAPKHYVHIGLIVDWESGEPKILEPNKQESWDWYELEKLPQPLFHMCELVIDSYKTGKNYYDYEN